MQTFLNLAIKSFKLEFSPFVDDTLSMFQIKKANEAMTANISNTNAVENCQNYLAENEQHIGL